MINTIFDILSDGARVLSNEAFEKRLEACSDCHCGSLKATAIHCSICGCNMNIKARFVASKCPESRWLENDKQK